MFRKLIELGDKMNYNIEYEKKSFMKAIDYIKENNLYRRGESNYDLWLIDFIKSTVKSAMHKYKSAGEPEITGCCTRRTHKASLRVAHCAYMSAMGNPHLFTPYHVR